MKKILVTAILCTCLVHAAPSKAEFNAHDWQLRLRGIGVVPDESTAQPVTVAPSQQSQTSFLSLTSAIS